MWQDAGFLTGRPDTELAMKQLAYFIDALPNAYNQFSASALTKKPAPDKWSRQEILGHLIDSALNNLKRFTDIQFLPQPYMVQAYRQGKLILVNNYAQLPLQHLISFWQLLNRQIIFVVENITTEKLVYRVNPQYNSNEMKTLAWIICDSVAQLKHHWKQVV